MTSADQEAGEERTQDHQLATWLVIGVAIVLVAALFGVRFEHQPETTRDYPSRALIPDGPSTLMDAPEIYDEYVPCADCHADRETDPTVRELEDEHEENVVVHGDLWCMHCHEPGTSGRLRLADGNLVDMEESWRLCTQCHADKLDDWRAGVHGKRTGNWRGPKEYRTCVVCHEPHAPAFKPLTPKPGPAPPMPVGSDHEADDDAEGESDVHS